MEDSGKDEVDSGREIGWHIGERRFRVILLMGACDETYGGNAGEWGEREKSYFIILYNKTHPILYLAITILFHQRRSMPTTISLTPSINSIL